MSGFNQNQNRGNFNTTQRNGNSNQAPAQQTQKGKYENITGLWTPKDPKPGSNLVASGICKDDGYTYIVFINQGYEEGSNKPQYNLVRQPTPQRV